MNNPKALDYFSDSSGKPTSARGVDTRRERAIFLGKRHGNMCRRRREERALPLPFVVVRGNVEGIGISAVTMTTRMRKKERYYGSGEMESHHAVEAVPAAVEPL